MKLGRNDPCHCGSGNKYKKCCLSKDEQARSAQLAAEAAARAASVTDEEHAPQGPGPKSSAGPKAKSGGPPPKAPPPRGPTQLRKRAI